MASSIPSSYPRPPKMPSASDVVSSGSFASPLAQFKESLPSSASTRTLVQHVKAQAVPALDLNLFRTPSVCSVDSLASTMTSGDSIYDFGVAPSSGTTTPTTPTTPRANKNQASYFGSRAADTTPTKAAPSSSSSASSASVSVSASQRHDQEQLTPERSFRVPSREQQPIRGRPRALSRPEPAARAPLPTHPPRDLIDSDLHSVHGEQGSEWGDDEANFEWLDTDGAPEAVNGKGTGRNVSSPSKAMSRIKASVPGLGAGEGRKLKKPLVFARRAPPPPSAPDSTVPKPISHPHHLQPTSPPKHAGSTAITDRRERVPAPGLRPPSFRSSSHPPHPPAVRRNPAPTATTHHNAQPSHRPQPIALLPLKDSTSSATNRDPSRNSKMSIQSVAYSFYDLDPEWPSTPRPGTPSGELLFPRGKYSKVPLSKLEIDTRERTSSAPEPKHQHHRPQHQQHPSFTVEPHSADELVGAGVEARGKGDLPKAAWHFMKAAEMGSATGRMYWGLALRHGWGIARDDKKAFIELRRACDESLAGGPLPVDFHRSAGTTKLTPQQERTMTRDLSVGLFEIANCFLEGVGVKKAPDVAVSYLRFAANMGDVASQEQLGFLLSKGAGGIKKDMKEAAKWYRMAIAQGSTNTFGLAWIWKDKYMD